MTAPLVRVVCEKHPGKTVGKVLAEPSGPVYEAVIPIKTRVVGPGKPGRRGVAAELEVRVLLSDPTAKAPPTWCPECRRSARIEVERLKLAVRDDVAVLAVSLR